MNIFKILASGNGRIHEPNVSAFLGYLLNPKADHGLNDELLKKVLIRLYQKNKESSLKTFLVDKHENPRNLSIRSKFEIEVLLEQAFKQDITESKQIVDIVILCFEKNTEKNQSLAKSILSGGDRATELKQIFLIENKVKDDSTKEEQLNNQVKSTIDTLTKVLNKSKEELTKILSLIFISPKGKKSSEEYSKFKYELSNIPSLHLHWTEQDDIDDFEEGETTIIELLRSILLEENQGAVDAINEFTKHTLKSFINFVENDFRSIIDEELIGKNQGKTRSDPEEFFEGIAAVDPTASQNLALLHKQLSSTDILAFPKFSPTEMRVSYYFTEKDRTMFFYIDIVINKNRKEFEINYLSHQPHSADDEKHKKNKKPWFKRRMDIYSANLEEITDLFNTSHEFYKNHTYTKISELIFS